MTKGKEKNEVLSAHAVMWNDEMEVKLKSFFSSALSGGK